MHRFVASINFHSCIYCNVNVICMCMHEALISLRFLRKCFEKVVSSFYIYFYYVSKLYLYYVKNIFFKSKITTFLSSWANFIFWNPHKPFNLSLRNM